MILPSLPSKFDARKNENNFIQVPEAYIYTLIIMLPLQLHVTLLPVSESTLHDVTILWIHSDFQVRCFENETCSIVTHHIRATDRMLYRNADRLNTSFLILHLI